MSIPFQKSLNTSRRHLNFLFFFFFFPGSPAVKILPSNAGRTGLIPGREAKKEMATHSSVLAWRLPVTAEPGGLPSMGSHRVGHD